jgi:hypothetical protein
MARGAWLEARRIGGRLGRWICMLDGKGIGTGGQGRWIARALRSFRRQRARRGIPGRQWRYGPLHRAGGRVETDPFLWPFWSVLLNPFDFGGEGPFSSTQS